LVQHRRTPFLGGLSYLQGQGAEGGPLAAQPHQAAVSLADQVSETEIGKNAIPDIGIQVVAVVLFELLVIDRGKSLLTEEGGEDC